MSPTTRTEADLRDALRELERRADRDGGPSSATLLAHARRRERPARRTVRWGAPLAVAAVVAGAAVVVAVTTGGSGPQRRAGGTSTAPPATSSAPAATTSPATPSPAASVLAAAAARLDAAGFTAPAPARYFYVRTTQASTWTAVSGTRAGRGTTSTGVRVWVPGCAGGHYTRGSGQSGPCTLDSVGHYRADAPTVPGRWDAYLERIAPGAKAAGAQGKIIVQVLMDDLLRPAAAAALLRYTASCPGLHTLAVRPVQGHRLTGVTCTSMTNGSYGLTFDARTHAFDGFVGVDEHGRQDGAAEVVLRTGVVRTVHQVP